LNNGAFIAIVDGGVQEGDLIATGVAETTLAAAPAAGSPLLPQFGRRGGGAGGGGNPAGRGGP
jgi:hypothetical protein